MVTCPIPAAYNPFTLNPPRSAARFTAPGGWLIALIAAYIAVFVLPFRFPLRQPVLSDTWIAGANNQAAAIALGMVSIGVALVLWRTRDRAESTLAPAAELQRGYLFAAIAAATVWIAILGSAEARIHTSWGDEAYFLTQLRTG